jgi:4-amino-4-deoxy-L-arabinose transferase-like glycosyltransferase
MLGYWDVEARRHGWGLIAVLIVVGLGFVVVGLGFVVVGLGFVASVVFSDQLQELFVRVYGFLD